MYLCCCSRNHGVVSARFVNNRYLLQEKGLIIGKVKLESLTTRDAYAPVQLGGMFVYDRCRCCSHTSDLILAPI